MLWNLGLIILLWHSSGKIGQFPQVPIYFAETAYADQETQ